MSRPDLIEEATRQIAYHGADWAALALVELRAQLVKCRDETLEEAARIADERAGGQAFKRGAAVRIAEAIRGLKSRHPQGSKGD